MSPVWPISRSISLVHLPLTFFHKPRASHLAPHLPPIVELAWYYPPRLKNYLKWREICFLSTWLEDGFKGKVLLYNVRKFYTRSFSHWRATTLWIIKTGFSQYLSIGYKTGFRRFSHICSPVLLISVKFNKFTTFWPFALTSKQSLKEYKELQLGQTTYSVYSSVTPIKSIAD